MLLRGRVKKKKNLYKVNKTACRNLSYSVRKVLSFLPTCKWHLDWRGLNNAKEALSDRPGGEAVPTCELRAATWFSPASLTWPRVLFEPSS